AARSPLALGRGTAAPEQQLRNARDAWAPMSFAVASYAALEAAAADLGDDASASLARRHRELKERTLVELRDVIRLLAQDVIAEGDDSVVPAGGAGGASDVAAR